MIFFLQGSYGIVKLAYNETDDTHYVSDNFIVARVYFKFRIQFVGHEDFVQKKAVAESWRLRSTRPAEEQIE